VPILGFHHTASSYSWIKPPSRSPRTSRALRIDRDGGDSRSPGAARSWPRCGLPAVVMAGVGAQDPFEMSNPAYQDPVQAFVPHRSHPPLGEGVGPRRSDRRADLPDALGPKDLVERSGVTLRRGRGPGTGWARIGQPGGLTDVEGLVRAVNRIIARHTLPGDKATRPGVLGHALGGECPGSASKPWLGNRWGTVANGTLPS
jgi:hypothetical protein